MGEGDWLFSLLFQEMASSQKVRWENYTSGGREMQRSVSRGVCLCVCP